MTPWSAMTGQHTYHTFTLERFVNAPRFFHPSSNKDPIPIQEMDRVEFCYTGRDMNAAQAICQHVGGGDADNADQGNWVEQKSYADGIINVQLAELVCPKVLWVKRVRYPGMHIRAKTFFPTSSGVSE